MPLREKKNDISSSGKCTTVQKVYIQSSTSLTHFCCTHENNRELNTWHACHTPLRSTIFNKNVYALNAPDSKCVYLAFYPVNTYSSFPPVSLSVLGLLSPPKRRLVQFTTWQLLAPSPTVHHTNNSYKYWLTYRSYKASRALCSDLLLDTTQTAHRSPDVCSGVADLCTLSRDTSSRLHAMNNLFRNTNTTVLCKPAKPTFGTCSLLANICKTVIYSTSCTAPL